MRGAAGAVLPRAAAVAMAAAAAAMAPGAARAQGLTPTIRLKLGAFLPNDGDTKHFAGNTHFSAEADLGLPASGGQTLLSAGISVGKRGSRTYTVVPLGLSKVAYLGNPAAAVTGNFYYGGGIGAYLLHASGGGEPSRSATRYGIFLQAGYQLPATGFFVEGKYHLVSGSLEGLGPSGLTLFLGKRL